MSLRRILPSKVRTSLRRLLSQPEFAGDYPSWSAASRVAKGFDVRQIADKVRAAALPSCLINGGTPFIDRETDRIAIQSPPRAIYGGSFPHWFFSKAKFANFMSGLGLSSFAEWPGFDHQANIRSQYRGRIYVAASEVSSENAPGTRPSVG